MTPPENVRTTGLRLRARAIGTQAAPAHPLRPIDSLTDIHSVVQS